MKQIAISEILEGWEEAIIGDRIELVYGDSLPGRVRRQGAVPVFGSNGITGFHDKALVKGPGVIIGRKGTVGAVVFSKSDFWPIDTTYYVKLKTKGDIVFWYYLLQTLGLSQMNSHSAVPGLNRDNVYGILKAIPSFNEQRAIAKILSDLDDKIELNHQMNKTLESITQALFKRWFVDFEFPGHEKTKFVDGLPEGWKTGKLKDILTHSRETIVPSNNPQATYFHYSLPAYDTGHAPVQEKGEEILSNKFMVKKHSILVSKLNPRIPRIWAIGEVDENCSICSTEFQVFIPKEQIYYSYVALFFSAQPTKDLMVGKATGTSGSHQRVRPEDILDIEVLIPHKDVLRNFESSMGNSFQKISLNLEQSQYLGQIRDSLLPRLMSGSLRLGSDWRRKC